MEEDPYPLRYAFHIFQIDAYLGGFLKESTFCVPIPRNLQNV
jgi:hypothetical protein